jgi:hypothetical protein
VSSAALKALVDAVDATGGLESEGATIYPAADPDWIDLADVYLTACIELELHPLIDGKRVSTLYSSGWR